MSIRSCWRRWLRFMSETRSENLAGGGWVVQHTSYQAALLQNQFGGGPQVGHAGLVGERLGMAHQDAPHP